MCALRIGYEVVTVSIPSLDLGRDGVDGSSFDKVRAGELRGKATAVNIHSAAPVGGKPTQKHPTAIVVG